MIAGDFDRDGRLDLAVASYGSNETFILLGNGDGTFRPPGNTVAAADTPFLDRGGGFRRGWAARDPRRRRWVSERGLPVLHGHGDGILEPAGSYETGYQTVGIAALDLNGDNHLDLVATCNQGSTEDVLLGDGDGRFRVGGEYRAGAFPGPILAGDFNGDGRLDLAVGDQVDPGGTSNGAVGILLGDGTGSRSSRRRGAKRGGRIPLRDCGGRLRRRRQASTSRSLTHILMKYLYSWVTAMARSSPLEPILWARNPSRSLRRISMGTGGWTSRWPNTARARYRSCLAMGMARSSPPSDTRSDSPARALVAGDFDRDGRGGPRGREHLLRSGLDSVGPRRWIVPAGTRVCGERHPRVDRRGGLRR